MYACVFVTIRSIRMDTSVREQTFYGHARDVCSAAFSPDGASVITASGDGSAKIWDATSGECLRIPYASPVRG